MSIFHFQIRLQFLCAPVMRSFYLSLPLSFSDLSGSIQGCSLSRAAESAEHRQFDCRLYLVLSSSILRSALEILYRNVCFRCSITITICVIRMQSCNSVQLNICNCLALLHLMFWQLCVFPCFLWFSGVDLSSLHLISFLFTSSLPLFTSHCLLFTFSLFTPSYYHRKTPLILEPAAELSFFMCMTKKKEEGRVSHLWETNKFLSFICLLHLLRKFP